MTDFAEFIRANRSKIEEKRASLMAELDELNVEMAAIDAYEEKKRERLSPRWNTHNGTPSGRSIGTGRYPHEGDGTLSVPQAGREFLGLSESGSWLAARRGDIPTIKISRYRRVPVDAMRRKLEERRPQSKVREEEGYPGSLVPG